MSYKYLTVTPSHGRDYATAEAALADWNDGKDFIIRDVEVMGTYINNGDLERYPQFNGRDLIVSIRYNKLADIVMVNKPPVSAEEARYLG